MSKTISVRIIISAAFSLLAIAATGSAQTPAPSTAPPAAAPATQSPSPERQTRRPLRRVPTPPARVTVVPNETQLAPQVVTIVHRLTGVKLLRLLQRQVGENSVIESIDPQMLTTDAHASILAGWALDDGKTIAARLPQAGAEIEITETVDTRAQSQARAATAAPFPRPRIEPDLTVITGDGQKFRAHLVGLDGETGLSILQVIGTLPPAPAPRSNGLIAGQRIQIFAPEPLTPESEVTTHNIYVKLGRIDATLATASPANAEAFGTLDKLVARGAKFSPQVIGGIACDQFGNTLGIVDSVEGSSLSIVSAATVRAATDRVLARQASVPRPLLGVRGEPVGFGERAALLAFGWRDDQVKELLEDQIGILLTTVVPKTPAALAKLQAGDVIMRVNQKDIKSAQDFSNLLGKAGSGEQVQFTVKRPAATAPLEIPVKLGGSWAPTLEWSSFDPSGVTAAFFSLQRLGVQTIGLTPKDALGFGAQNGLVVVGVQPASAAARGGIREGDVIESIDGRVVGRGVWTFGPAFSRQKKHTVLIVRDREKKQIVLEVEE
jgi:S1-C subfamily serine protease